MSSKDSKYCIILLMTLLLCRPIAHASEGEHTMVLAIGEDKSFDGSLKTLRFATIDSKRFARAMEIVADVPKTNIQVVTNASLGEFRQSLTGLLSSFHHKTSIKRFILFFSGHSDERGLHFQDGLFTKEDLHAFLKKVPSPTKISILDSCYSGALAAKGIEPATEFAIPHSDYDEPTGTVFLTASSADEGAFESTRLQGSVFSNYLVSGLYGHADANNDGLVTVDELYQFIYQKTRYDNLMLPKSVQQKPEFVSKLQGRGALVLSTPKANMQTLQIDPKIIGDIHLQSTYGLRSYLVSAQQRASNTVRLPSGEYNLSVQQGSNIGRTTIRLMPNRVASLQYQELEWSPISANHADQKGADSAPPSVATSMHPPKKSFASSFAVGTHSGYFAHEATGPALGFSLHGPTWDLGVVGVAPVASTFLRQNHLYRDLGDGVEKAISFQLGGHASLPPRIHLVSFRPYVVVVAGMSLMTQRWTINDGQTTENYHTTVPLMHMGIGVARGFSMDSKIKIAAEYRREIARIQDQEFGTAQVGANIYSIGVVY